MCLEPEVGPSPNSYRLSMIQPSSQGPPLHKPALPSFAISCCFDGFIVTMLVKVAISAVVARFAIRLVVAFSSSALACVQALL